MRGLVASALMAAGALAVSCLLLGASLAGYRSTNWLLHADRDVLFSPDADLFNFRDADEGVLFFPYVDEDAYSFSYADQDENYFTDADQDALHFADVDQNAYYFTYADQDIYYFPDADRDVYYFPCQYTSEHYKAAEHLRDFSMNFMRLAFFGIFISIVGLVSSMLAITFGVRQQTTLGPGASPPSHRRLPAATEVLNVVLVLNCVLLIAYAQVIRVRTRQLGKKYSSCMDDKRETALRLREVLYGYLVVGFIALTAAVAATIFSSGLAGRIRAAPNVAIVKLRMAVDVIMADKYDETSLLDEVNPTEPRVTQTSSQAGSAA